MAMEEKLKRVVEELKKQAEVWNEEYDDTMIEEIDEDVREIFKEYGFREVELSDEAIYELYKKTERGFEQVFNYRKLEKQDIIVSAEGIIEFLERKNFVCFAEADGFYVENAFYTKYQIYHNNRDVAIVVRKTAYTTKDYEPKFYDIVGVFKLKK